MDDEKPFIISIQDRSLNNGESVTYYMNGNAQSNMDISTNNEYVTKITQNRSYSGMDLINCSLTRKSNVNIYMENY